MMTAAGAIVTIAVTLAAIMLPGWLLGTAVRLRGRLLWGAAPAMTFGFVGAAARGYPALGLSWRPVTVLGGLLVCAAAAWAVTWMCRRRWGRACPPEPARRGRYAVGAAMAASMSTGVGVLLVATDRLTAIPQEWDAVFHGVAIRLIERTGDASPFALAAASEPANPDYYYPDAFHALGALVFRLPGQQLPEVYNAMLAAIPVVFVLAAVALVQRIDPRPVSLAAAGVLAGAFGTFPLLTVMWGPLSPFGMSAAVAPGVLAAVLAAMRRPAVPSAVAIALGASGVYVLHPSVAVVLGAVSVLVVANRLIRGGRRSAALVALGAAGAAALVATYPSMDFSSVDEMESFHWPVTASAPEAVRDLLSFSALGHATWLLLVPVVIGMLTLRRYPDLRPIALCAAVIGVLYVLTASSDADIVRNLTALWWNDKHRFAALFTVVVLPLAAAGMVRIIESSAALSPSSGSARSTHWGRSKRLGGRHRLPRRTRGRRSGSARTAVPVLLLLALYTATVSTHWQVAAVRSLAYSGGTVHPSERAAYARLADVYDGGTVMNDPFDGSPWAYTLFGLPMVMPAMTGPDPVRAQGADRMTLYRRLDEYGMDPEVAASVRALDVRWVIVGDGILHENTRAPGFAGLAGNPGFDPVIVKRHATVYRVVRRPR